MNWLQRQIVNAHVVANRLNPFSHAEVNAVSQLAVGQTFAQLTVTAVKNGRKLTKQTGARAAKTSQAVRTTKIENRTAQREDVNANVALKLALSAAKDQGIQELPQLKKSRATKAQPSDATPTA